VDELHPRGVAAQVGDERLGGEEAHDEVVDRGPEDHRGPDDRHRPVPVLVRPELADPVGLGLVARVLERGDPPHGVLLGQGHRVVRERAVGGRRRGHQHLADVRLGSGLEDVAGAVDVDLVHRALVVDRVEDEGQVDERVGALAREQLVDPAGVADVELLVAGLGPEGARRSDVADRDPLGLFARR
jgi:hypothetical protein